MTADLARKQAEGGATSTTTLGGQDDLNTGGTDDLPSHNSVSEAGASDLVPSASVSTNAPDGEVNQGINRPRSRSSPLIATSTHIDDRDNSSAEADEEDDESMPAPRPLRRRLRSEFEHLLSSDSEPDIPE
ncbi:hypothetical protein PRIC1_011184 [Phytophthora ramorum]